MYWLFTLFYNIIKMKCYKRDSSGPQNEPPYAKHGNKIKNPLDGSLKGFC